MSEVRNATTTFFEAYQAGSLAEDDIYDFVGDWHDQPGGGAQALSAYLGLTDEEYAVWVMDAHTLPLIRTARAAHEPLRKAVERYLRDMRAAARPEDRGAIMSLSHWVGRPVE